MNVDEYKARPAPDIQARNWFILGSHRQRRQLSNLIPITRKSKAGMTDQHRQLVVGGHNVQEGRYPYFVSIDKNNGVIVSGALIAPDIVLSAGHIALDNMDNLTLKVGPCAVHENETFAEEIPVERWFVPSEWRQTFDGTFFTNDYIILKLAAKSSHQPIRINTDPEIPHPNSPVILMGLGWTEPHLLSPASIVQEAELLMITNAECEAISDPSRGLTYSGMIDESMLCTKAPPNKTRDACAWDSGAPVIVAGETSDEDLLVALGSSGIGCADEVFPGIQARVSAPYGADWIRKQVCALSNDPPLYFNCTMDTVTSDSDEVSPQLGMTTANLLPDSVFEIESNAMTSAAVVLVTGVFAVLAMTLSKRYGLSPNAGTRHERTEFNIVPKQATYDACQID